MIVQSRSLWPVPASYKMQSPSRCRGNRSLAVVVACRSPALKISPMSTHTSSTNVRHNDGYSEIRYNNRYNDYAWWSREDLDPYWRRVRSGRYTELRANLREDLGREELPNTESGVQRRASPACPLRDLLRPTASGRDVGNRGTAGRRRSRAVDLEAEERARGSKRMRLFLTCDGQLVTGSVAGSPVTNS